MAPFSSIPNRFKHLNGRTNRFHSHFDKSELHKHIVVKDVDNKK